MDDYLLYKLISRYIPYEYIYEYDENKTLRQACVKLLNLLAFMGLENQRLSDEIDTIKAKERSVSYLEKPDGWVDEVVA